METEGRAAGAPFLFDQFWNCKESFVTPAGVTLYFQSSCRLEPTPQWI